MAFLSVIFAYLLSRHTSASKWLQHDGGLHLALQWLADIKPGTSTAFFIAVAGSGLFTAWLFLHLPFWLHFFLAIAVLLFSTGRNNWRSYTTECLAQLRDGNAETVWLSLESQGMLEPAAGADALWYAIRKQAAYLYLTEWFAIFFWFSLLGPAGSLFFRLLALYNEQAVTSNGKLPTLAKWQSALEWLPTRYMGLCFCLSGNFATCFHTWRQLVVDTHTSNQDFLARCADTALIVEAPASSSTNPVTDRVLQLAPSLQDLLAHTEIIGLVGLALAVLVLH